MLCITRASSFYKRTSKINGENGENYLFWVLKMSVRDMVENGSSIHSIQADSIFSWKVQGS